MPGRKHKPREKAYSYSPGPVVQSSILKTISWINVTFDSSLTTNRSQDRKKALLLPLLFPRGYFSTLLAEVSLRQVLWRVHCRSRVWYFALSACLRPRGRSYKPSFVYEKFTHLIFVFYIYAFLAAFHMIAQGVGVLFDRISVNSPCNCSERVLLIRITVHDKKKAFSTIVLRVC